MKFISSETFPELNYFSNFLSQNGGYSNAYTSDLHTNYYFKVTSNSIEGSLKRFAHMFIDPVFKAEAVDKESSAVNSEYLFDLNNDSWKV
jgi:insulysin